MARNTRWSRTDETDTDQTDQTDQTWDGGADDQFSEATANFLTADADTSEGENVASHDQLITTDENADAEAQTDETAEKPKRTYTRHNVPEVSAEIAGAFEDVPEDEWPQTQPVVRGVRSDAQQIMDASVRVLKEKWENAGKPDAARSPRHRHIVNPEDVASVKRMLGKAATFNNVKIAYSPKATKDDGREVIVYTVSDKPPAKPATETASETAD